MHIASVNTSHPVDITFNAETVSTGIFKTPQTGAVRVTPRGLAGDTIADLSVHGGRDQALYLYSQQDYDWWSLQLGRPVQPGSFGENLTLAGTEDMLWQIGDRLEINDVLLEITAPRIPCYKLGVSMEDKSFVKKFVLACRPGAYARVLHKGMLSPGDPVRYVKAGAGAVSVNAVFMLWHSRNKPAEQLEKMLQSPIAQVHRSWLDSAT